VTDLQRAGRINRGEGRPVKQEAVRHEAAVPVVGCDLTRIVDAGAYGHHGSGCVDGGVPAAEEETMDGVSVVERANQLSAGVQSVDLSQTGGAGRIDGAPVRSAVC